MPLSLDDAPLEFRPDTRAPTIVFSLIILLELIFGGAFVVMARWPLERFFTTGLISTLSFVFMIGACVYGIIEARRRTDRLRIDDTGVTLLLDGTTRAWRWDEMNRFHLVTVNARSGLKRVAIEPKGAANFDAKANLIAPRFGPPTDALLTLLRAGKARWGGA
jgi:hypothetical protein